MRRRTFWPFVGLFAVLLVVVPCYRAWAVVPAVVGPVQALVAILPQLMALLLAAVVAMFKPETYKAFFKFLWSNKILTLCLAGAIFAAVWYGPGLFGGKVTEEQSGAPWMHMRGDLTRCGAVPGARGPMKGAKVMWSYAGRKRERVDSSAAVVGNRVYSTSAVLSLFGGKYSGSGVLYCRDTEGGGVVWKYTGAGMKGPSLASIFSSPAVGGEYDKPAKGAKGKDGKPPGNEPGRYLVCGEGYHIDIDSRLFCLDLLPLKQGQKKPKLVWVKQGTSHFESSPAIVKCHDGKWRTYMGGGDDGIWAVELESGKVAWMIEGTRSYYVHVKCKQIEQIKALEGKNVRVDCIVERFAATMFDPGQVLIMKVRKVEEVDKLTTVSTDAGDEDFRRTLVGTVRIGKEVPSVEGKSPGTRRKLKEASTVRIDIPRYYADVESAPAAVNLPVDPAKPQGPQQTLVFVGNGLPLKDFDAEGRPIPHKTGGQERLQGGSGLVCLDGISGEEKWFHEVSSPLFSAPTVIRNVTIKDKNGEEIKTTDVVIAGYGDGDFVNLGKGPGHVVCLDIHDVTDKRPKVLWSAKTGATILGAVAVKDGLAHACSADGKLYIVDISNGGLVKTIPLGVSLVCGPSVTEEAIYVTSMSGTAYCVDRKSYSVRWKLSVMPCGDMYSSPVVAGGRIYIGSPGQGLYCLKAGTSDYVRPWSGPGGTPSRSGASDSLGLPTVEGTRAPRKWKDYALVERVQKDGSESIVSRTVPGPLAACGKLLYTQAKRSAGDQTACLACLEITPTRGIQRWLADLHGPVTALAAKRGSAYALVGKGDVEQNVFCLDEETGKELWKTGALYARDVLTLTEDRLFLARNQQLVCLNPDTGQSIWNKDFADISGAPAAAHGLVFAAQGGANPRLVCMEDGGGRQMWSSLLPGKPRGAVTCTGDGVAVVCEVSNGGKPAGVIVIVSLIDGKRLGKFEVPAMPTGHPVVSDDYLAVAAEDGRVYAYDAKGKLLREKGILVGKPAQNPALVGGILVYAGKNKLATWNLTAGSYPWGYRGQRVMGRVYSAPVVTGETVFVTTEKRGLIAVGLQPVVRLLSSLKAVTVPKESAWLLAEAFETEEDLRAASLARIKEALPGDTELAAGIHRELHKDDEEKKKEKAR